MLGLRTAFATQSLEKSSPKFSAVNFDKASPKITINGLLVGGWATPLKNMNVNWDDEIPNIWENKIDGNQTTNQTKIKDRLPIKARPSFPQFPPKNVPSASSFTG